MSLRMAVCHTGSDTTMHHVTRQGAQGVIQNMLVTALNLYLRHIQNYKLSASHRLICITETCFNTVFRGNVVHLKLHLTAQNVNRIQQAAVQILLRTVLLSQLTSENLKQETSYFRTAFLNRRAAARYRPWHQLYRAARDSPGIDN